MRRKKDQEKEIKRREVEERERKTRDRLGRTLERGAFFTRYGMAIKDRLDKSDEFFLC